MRDGNNALEGGKAKVTLRELAKRLHINSPATAKARLDAALEHGALEQDMRSPAAAAHAGSTLSSTRRTSKASRASACSRRWRSSRNLFWREGVEVPNKLNKRPAVMQKLGCEPVCGHLFCSVWSLLAT
jgi:hypothetical protein